VTINEVVFVENAGRRKWRESKGSKCKYLKEMNEIIMKVV